MKYEQTDFMGAGRAGRPGRPGKGRGRGAWAGVRTTAAQRSSIQAWVAGRVPREWEVDPAEVRIDDDEVLVLVHLPDVESVSEMSADDRRTGETARIAGFREESRVRRIEIAEDAEGAFGRMVSWGACCGETTLSFTTASVPVMTRLRIDERLVLDTLVDAGVARSRSEALAWCVRLVGRNEDRWIADLRAAFAQVDQVRSRGPSSGGA